MFRLCAAIVVVLLLALLPACAYTCEQVQWGHAHPNDPLVIMLRKTASAEDIAKAKACFHKKNVHKSNLKHFTSKPAVVHPAEVKISPVPVVNPVPVATPPTAIQPPKGKHMFTVEGFLNSPWLFWLGLAALVWLVYKNGVPSVVLFFQRIYGYVVTDVKALEARVASLEGVVTPATPPVTPPPVVKVVTSAHVDVPPAA